MAHPLPIAKAEQELYLLPGLANRHGLITGATGTGKTVTLQVMGGSLQLDRRAGVSRGCQRRPVWVVAGWCDVAETEGARRQPGVARTMIRRLPGRLLGRVR